MIGFDSADDLFFVRPAERIVEVPNKLDLRVVGFRAGTAKEHLRDRDWRDLFELFSKLDCGVVTSASEQMGKRKLPHLGGSRFDKFLITVTERCTPKPGHPFDIAFALGVIDVDALRPLDNERPAFAEAGEVDVGMHQRFNVAGGQVAERRHGILVCRCVRRSRARRTTALMSSCSGGRKPQLRGDEASIALAHFVSDFFSLLPVKLAANGRGRGSGTSPAATAAACSACSSAGAADSACAGGGGSRSHWQSL